MVSLKVTGTCKKGLLLLFIIVLRCTNRTKQNKTTTVDGDGMKGG